MLRKLLLVALALGALGTTEPAWARADGAAKTHVVSSGQRLGSIAKRYVVTVEALCYANGIRERDPIKPGQRLVIPARDDKDGSRARAARLALATSSELARPGTVNASLRRAAPRREPGWRDYARRPRRKSFVELSSHNRKWRGLVLDTRGRIRAPARQGISALLGATGDHPGAPDRLLRLLVQVSDTFGGRPLYIVSGYRTTSHFEDSRHKTSQAVDFNVLGVPNAIVRDYLRTLPSVGVGYYPNSSFLHLDVRPRTTYWVDYAGPGEAPRKTPRGAVAATPTNVDDLAEEEASTTEATPSAERRVEGSSESAAPSP